MTTLTTPQDFAAAINGAWRETVDGVLRTAELYYEAHRDLGTNGWQDLLAHVPHADSTARRLVCVGRWRDGAGSWVPVSMLPPSWGTLYALSRVPASELRSAIAAGRVHAGMERKDAEALLPRKAKAPCPDCGNKGGHDATCPTITGPAASGLQSLVPTAAPTSAPSLPAAIDMLLALKDAEQPAHYAQVLPRTKLAVALAFLTAVHKLAK